VSLGGPALAGVRPQRRIHQYEFIAVYNFLAEPSQVRHRHNNLILKKKWWAQ
jgi:hypothetical protein